MQYKLLVSDFDNTLVFFGEPKPRPAVVKAVKKLQAAGVKFALSTGRAYPCVHREQLGGIRRHVGAQREHRQPRGRDRPVPVDVGRVAEGHLAEDRDVEHGFRP